MEFPLYLVCTQGSSDKFYSIELAGSAGKCLWLGFTAARVTSAVVIRHGRNGTKGVRREKHLRSTVSALALAEAQARAKLDPVKGYQRAAPPAGFFLEGKTASSSARPGKRPRPILDQEHLWEMCRTGSVSDIHGWLREAESFDLFGEGGLREACLGGNQAVAELLLERVDGTGVLLEASAKGEAQIIEVLVNAGQDVNSQEECRGRTPLHQACRCGHFKCVQLLLAKGASLSIRSKDGRSALGHACSEGHEDVVRVLLDAGATTEDVDVEDSWVDPVPPIQWACINDHAPIVELLIKRGASLETGDLDGESLLLKACALGHEQVVDALIRAGADVDECGGRDELTPLHAAAQRDYHRIIRQLLRAGAEVETYDHSNSFEPLEYAVRLGHVCSVRELLNAPRGDTLDPNILFEALRVGNAEIVRLLLEHGAPIRCLNEQGWCPLRVAAELGSAEIARLLLSYGAPAGGVQRERTWIHSILGLVGLAEEVKSPLELALRRGDKDVVREILVRVSSADDNQLEHCHPSLRQMLEEQFEGRLSKWKDHLDNIELRFRLLSWRCARIALFD